MITADHTHSEIYETCKYDDSEEIAYRTEPEIGDSIHKSQVRIVSCNFNDNYKIKRNTTMNVNRSQKHGHILNCITQAKSRTTKITVMHHTLTHFNSKSVKNPYFCRYFQCEKLTGNEIFLSLYISNHLFALIYHLGLIQDIQYLVSIILNNVTNFHVHTAISVSVILIFW